MNNTQEVRNAKIESTMLGLEDHGILTCYLSLDYGGTCQGFGGWCFDKPVRNGSEFKGRFGTAYGMEFIRRVLDTLGVDKWEKLPGLHCRVDADYGKVHAIGHIIKDKWFRPERDLVDFKQE